MLQLLFLQELRQFHKAHVPDAQEATQVSTAPLPLPILVSAGRFVTGLSGNTLIQVFPPRFNVRVITLRAASICRVVT